MLSRIWRSQTGQGLSEYALLVAAVVVLVILATTLFEEQMMMLFTSIGSYMQDQI